MSNSAVCEPGNTQTEELYNFNSMMFNFITSNPGVLNGKPVIKGTRISVEIILEWLAGGATVETIYQKYPYLPEGSVQEALQYAARFSENEILLEENIQP